MKIDDKAVVPLSWAVSGFASVIGITIFGVFWVASVNYRLQRIEEKLGIPPLQSSVFNGSIAEIVESGGVKDAYAKQLRKSVPLMPAHN